MLKQVGSARECELYTPAEQIRYGRRSAPIGNVGHGDAGTIGKGHHGDVGRTADAT